MKCPTCPETTLVMTDRSGIEIDYCPDCRGVWLDRGELDKVIERNAATATQLAAPPSEAPALDPRSRTTSTGQDRLVRRDDDDDFDDDDDDNRRYSPEHRSSGRPVKKKRTSFLGDLFEF